MQFTKPFLQLNKKSAAIAGGKGASLGEMLNHGVPVPDGFVILASAFDRFLAETKIDTAITAALARVNKNDATDIKNISKLIQGLILRKKMPPDLGAEILAQYKKQKLGVVAVRSSATAEDSATASWAGELESYLGVTEKNLLGCVKKCWASLFTPRAIFYRGDKKMMTTPVSVAVVVQKMIDSEISGIAFTVHPVTQNKNQLVIEAGYGLGEAIVGGMITPDTYVLAKKTQEILTVNISQQKIKIVRDPKGLTRKTKTTPAENKSQKLNAAQIFELAKICMAIAKHYKFPCDIEWAFQKKKFYIVQSRPITTLKK